LSCTDQVLVEFFDLSCEACCAYHPVLLLLRYTVFHKGPNAVVQMLASARRQGLFEPALDALPEEQPSRAVYGAPERDVACEIAGAAGSGTIRLIAIMNGNGDCRL
jgi:hypothetical protein